MAFRLKLRSFETRFPLIFWSAPALLGIYMIFAPVFFSQFRIYLGDEEDSRFIQAILEFGYQSLFHPEVGFTFWNPPFYYPEPNVMAYSDHFLGILPIYSFFRFLEISPIPSFSLTSITILLLNYGSACLLLNRGFRLSRFSSAIGAFIFAFASSRMIHYCHFNHFIAFPSVLAIFGLIESFRAPKTAQRRVWELVFFTSIVWQILCWFYLGWFLVLGLFFSLVWTLLQSGTRKKFLEVLRDDWAWMGGLSVVSGLVLFPVASHFFAAAREVGFRTIHDVKEPKLQSWIFLGGESLLYSWQDKIRAYQVIQGVEQKIGIGFLSLALALRGLWVNRSRVSIRLLGLVFLSFFFLMTSFFHWGTLWYFLFPWIPGSGAIRALSRVGVALLPVFSVGIALSIDEFRKTKSQAFVAFVAVLCMAEQIRYLGYTNSWVPTQRVQKLISRLPPNCESYKAIYPRHSSVKYEIDNLWVTLTYPKIPRLPTLNGYSGNAPRFWSIQEETAPADWIKKWASHYGKNQEKTCVIAGET